MDGVELCRLLHRRSDVRIIVITARGSIPARVETLDAGADDYLVKPFGFDELLARMRALLRRSGDPDSPDRGRRSDDRHPGSASARAG